MPEQKPGGYAGSWGLDLRGTQSTELHQVRHWMSRTLRDLDKDQLVDVLMVADELLANAYEHTSGPSCMRLAYRPVPCRVVVEVYDLSPAQPVVRHPAGLVPHGRGMQLVDECSDAWGTPDDPRTGGKTVWARIACNP